MLLSKTVWEPIISSKECFSMKLDLLTNATVVDDAIRFVSQKSQDKQKVKSAISEGDKQESNESVYDDDEGQLEEQEEEAGEISSITTTNQVF